ncbi:hypothetical protein HPB51_017689 [Rhipicephalus microplus]|uniref:Uncharacterized protein n=1 Tax=Rhipicephalus microplus TaxID=6941 RepID=A0A9J6E1Z8_RHIMP|nr:hypothetical protein HPB51_017689 [Rhipicephalus microplus]
MGTCAADAKKVGDEAALENEEGCADKGAENKNAEAFTEVEDEIVEKEAKESQQGEGEGEGSQHCDEEEVADANAEVEDCVEREAAENWEAGADIGVGYYKKGDGVLQDAQWDELGVDQAEVVHDVDDAEGMCQECAQGNRGEDHVTDNYAVHDETARDTHDYSAEDSAQADGTEITKCNVATTEDGICKTSVLTHAEELERHFKGKKHQVKVELVRQEKLKPGCKPIKYSEKFIVNSSLLFNFPAYYRTGEVFGDNAIRTYDYKTWGVEDQSKRQLEQLLDTNDLAQLDGKLQELQAIIMEVASHLPAASLCWVQEQFAALRSRVDEVQEKLKPRKRFAFKSARVSVAPIGRWPSPRERFVVSAIASPTYHRMCSISFSHTLCAKQLRTP